MPRVPPADISVTWPQLTNPTRTAPAKRTRIRTPVSPVSAPGPRETGHSSPRAPLGCGIFSDILPSVHAGQCRGGQQRGRVAEVPLSGPPGVFPGPGRGNGPISSTHRAGRQGSRHPSRFHLRLLIPTRRPGRPPLERPSWPRALAGYFLKQPFCHHQWQHVCALSGNLLEKAAGPGAESGVEEVASPSLSMAGVLWCSPRPCRSSCHPCWRKRQLQPQRAVLCPRSPSSTSGFFPLPPPVSKDSGVGGAVTPEGLPLPQGSCWAFRSSGP